MSHVEIREISPELVTEVCVFLAREIGRGTCPADFSAAFEARWADGPVGLALVANDRVVGAMATIRSARPIRGRLRAFCNVSSWAVATPFRAYAPALVQRAIADPETIVTNFTASAAATRVLRAFRFAEMPDQERVLLPIWHRSSRSVTWTVNLDAIESTLRSRGYDDAANRVRDHRGTRARWILVDFGGECCAIAIHLMRVHYARFGYVLYCSAPERFIDSLGGIRQACMRTWGHRFIAWPAARFGNVAGSISIRRPRPVLFRGSDVTAADLDGLYTELALLPILR